MTTKNHKQKNFKESVVLNLSPAKPLSQFDKCQFCRQTTLTNQDWKIIFEMEANPPEPTERMKNALRIYHQIIGDQNSIDSSCLHRLSGKGYGSINPQKTSNPTESRL